ncbi:MAG TPA: xylulokinase [Firmicutes bacterium]|nr:xylulokinase [Bacillota bacterium]
MGTAGRSFILAHDLGTTGDKATLFDGEGTLIASVTSGYETIFPRPGWAEQDPRDWWKGVSDSTRGLLSSGRVAPHEIACIVFSGQMMGCLPVDRSLSPLRNAIIWADQRGVAQSDMILEQVGEDLVYEITGHRISPAYSASKILWVKENEPEVWKHTYKVLHAKDYIIARLTGKAVTDYSDASGMNLFDLRQREWSGEIADAIGIPLEVLPELHRSTDVVGEVTGERARELGLVAGTPVVVGGGDGPCAAVGAGVVEEGQCYNYIGASSWIAMASREPLYDPRKRTFNFHHLDPEMVTPTGTMQSAGASYQWARRELCLLEAGCARELGISPYAIMDAEVDTVAPGADNLIYLPYLMGERSPHWNPFARGAFIGLSMAHTRRHMIRAVLEGVAFNLRIILECFESQGAKIDEIRVIGGGAKGGTWRQILADVYRRPVVALRLLEEATSLGAAIAGGIGVGIFKGFGVAKDLAKATGRECPRTEFARRYDELYKIFVDAYDALVPVFDALAR